MKRFWAFISFLGFYVKEVVQSNFRVAHDVLTPRHRMKPGIIRLELEELTDRQVLILSDLISMTPGTLCLDLSEDRRRLYIHVMYIDESVEAVTKGLKDDYERRVRRVF